MDMDVADVVSDGEFDDRVERVGTLGRTVERERERRVHGHGKHVLEREDRPFLCASRHDADRACGRRTSSAAAIGREADVIRPRAAGANQETRAIRTPKETPVKRRACRHRRLGARVDQHAWAAAVPPFERFQHTLACERGGKKAAVEENHFRLRRGTVVRAAGTSQKRCQMPRNRRIAFVRQPKLAEARAPILRGEVAGRRQRKKAFGEGPYYVVSRKVRRHRAADDAAA